MCPFTQFVFIHSFIENPNAAFSCGFCDSQQWGVFLPSLTYSVNENCLADIFYSGSIVWVMTYKTARRMGTFSSLMWSDKDICAHEVQHTSARGWHKTVCRDSRDRSLYLPAFQSFCEPINCLEKVCVTLICIQSNWTNTAPLWAIVWHQICISKTPHPLPLNSPWREVQW